MDNVIESAKKSDPIRTGIASTFKEQVKKYYDGIPRSDATGRMYKRHILADAIGVINTAPLLLTPACAHWRVTSLRTCSTYCRRAGRATLAIFVKRT